MVGKDNSRLSVCIVSFYWGRCGAHPEETVKWKLDYLPL